MGRRKTKSSLVDGIVELVNSLRNIESQIGLMIKSQKRLAKISVSRGRGRPLGSGKKNKPGRPSGSGRGPGRPPKKSNSGPGRPPKAKSAGPGRPRSKRRGRPPGSKNK